MPGGDGTGPMRTGGWCTPLWQSGQMPRPRGFFRRGFGWRRFYSMPSPSKEQEKNILEQELKSLEIEEKAIKKRMQELNEA